MISEEIKALFDQLQEREDMKFLEAASDEQIKNFEKEHEVSFPAKYREWLLLCDGGELYLPAGVQFSALLTIPLLMLPIVTPTVIFMW